MYVSHAPPPEWDFDMLLGPSVSWPSDIGNDDLINTNGSLVHLQFEPMILHIACRTPEAARALATAANTSGFRESGINSSGTNVAVRSSALRLDVPIAIASPHSISMIVSRAYVDMILKMARERYDENIRRISRFVESFRRISVPPVCAPLETKDQRRERKRREGLERQKALHDSRSIIGNSIGFSTGESIASDN
ncbi:methyltransferase TYW3-domain-containing protein [Dipodascopsis uninucleata]